MARAPMPIVTQVAPYAEGPAGVHGVLTQAAIALSELAALEDLEPVVVTDVGELDGATLAAAPVAGLFTIGETPFSEAQRATIEARWRAGDLALLGVHSATDACHGWPAYGSLLGARFDGHPWTQDFEITVVDHHHPATAHLGERLSWHDEVYLFKELQPEARVLLTLDPGQLDLSVPDGRVPDWGVPLAWCLDGGGAGGRTFYSALGHFHSAWEMPAYLRHLAGGLRWLLDR